MNGHKIINQNAPHYMTFTVVGWIDVFSRKAYKEVVTETMKFFDSGSTEGLRRGADRDEFMASRLGDLYDLMSVYSIEVLPKLFPLINR